MRWPLPCTAIALAALMLVAITLSLTQGALSLPARDSLLAVLDALAGSRLSALETLDRVVVLELRLPRTLLALLVGALLAQCGTVTQGVFRNPLADPGIIGVSSGAAVGAVIAIVWWPSQPWAVPLFAFAGGLVTTLLVYRLAQSPHGTSVFVLLLAGIAISAFAGAAVGFAGYFSDDQKLRQLSLWQMGALGGGTSRDLLLAAAALLLIGWQFQRHATALNALLLGEAEARHLGIAVEAAKFRLIVLSAIGVGVAVACAGMIGFIGLVVPHLVRLTTGPNHHSLLPLSALCGALLLLVADLLARLLVQPAEMPVGLVTALLGAPFFMILLLQQRQQAL